MTSNLEADAVYSVRLEIGSFARFGDIINDSNEVIAKIWIPKGLKESESVEAWTASIDAALNDKGFERVTDPEASLPFTRENALKRYVMELSAA